MNFILIGSGNMAHFLAQRLSGGGHTCVGIYSRNRVTAEQLAVARQWPLLDALSEVHDGADACILAVPDAEVVTLAAQLSFRTTTLVHTSGSVSIQALNTAEHAAVLWPVYSIIKDSLPAAQDFPCVWEATTLPAQKVVTQLAQSISTTVVEINSLQRPWLHLAAVMGNNFINHLMALCSQVCKDHHIPYSLLQPILQQTFEQQKMADPYLLQTGPALRHDTNTIQRHLTMLAPQPAVQAVYEALTQSIQGNLSAIKIAAITFARAKRPDMYHIKYQFEQKGVAPKVIEFEADGRSLLELALENNIELHHNCGMVCACSTCHLYVEQGMDQLPEITDREEDFIDRARNPRINSRLGCQCILEEGGSGDVTVTLPDQSLIHGD